MQFSSSPSRKSGPSPSELVSGACGVWGCGVWGPSSRAVTGRLRGRSSFAGVAQLVEHRFCKPKVRGSSPLSSSVSACGSRVTLGSALRTDDRSPLSQFTKTGGMLSAVAMKFSEGCPSGQREQAVNLPASAYVGSNPSPSTATSFAQRSSTQSAGASCLHAIAGVAQLVERQPSKLNVAGSTPVSRSQGFAICSGFSRENGSALKTPALIAQLVERVLGKDEVTSSNLVEGSGRRPARRLAHVSFLAPAVSTGHLS